MEASHRYTSCITCILLLRMHRERLMKVTLEFTDRADVPNFRSDLRSERPTGPPRRGEPWVWQWHEPDGISTFPDWAQTRPSTRTLGGDSIKARGCKEAKRHTLRHPLPGLTRGDRHLLNVQDYRTLIRAAFIGYAPMTRHASRVKY